MPEDSFQEIRRTMIDGEKAYGEVYTVIFTLLFFKACPNGHRYIVGEVRDTILVIISPHINSYYVVWKAI